MKAPPIAPRPARSVIERFRRPPSVPETAFARWGHFVHRHRVLVLLMSLLLVAGSLAVLLQGAQLQPYEPPPNTESGRAARLLSTELSSSRETSFVLILSHDAMRVEDDAFQAAANATLAPLRADPRVEAVRTPYDVSPQAAASMTSTDQHRLLAIVYLNGAPEEAQEAYAELRPRVQSGVLDVVATDQLAVFHDIEAALERDLVRAESVSLPLSLALLILVFGTLVAALLPIGVGAFAVMGGIAATFLLADVMDVAVYALNVVSLIGLGVAIDYSLFVVSRFREELRRSPVPDALARAMATSGRAVVFSGLTVGVGLAGLAFYQGMFVVTMGLAGALVVAIAILYALTFLPALLALLGPRINRLRIPGRRLERTQTGRGGWHRMAEAVMRRPVLFLVPALLLIVTLSVPFLDINLANGGADQLPEGAESRHGFAILQEAFPQQGATLVSAVVEFPSGPVLSTARVGDLYNFTHRVARLPSVVGVESIVDLDPNMTAADYEALYASPPGTWPPGVGEAVNSTIGAHIALVQVYSSAYTTTPEARDLVRALRGDAIVGDGRALVTGGPAYDLDAQTLILRNTPFAMAFVVLATYVLLLLQTRSVVLPAKAIVMNFLSIMASFGAVVWIFQEGHLSNVLDFTPASIDASIPVLLFCIVFGLSMDYEVLLLSRMHEEYVATGDNRSAVARGLEKSGRLITSAAAIMVLVFASFGLAQVTIIKAFGVGLAIAVAMDATIVRAIIVPATMRLMGEWNWWGPGHWHRRPGPPKAPPPASTQPAGSAAIPALPRPPRPPAP